MNKQDQQTIITALSKAEVSYDEIRFSSSGKVTIRTEVTDPQTIRLAQAGIFSPLKSQAIKIWDTLGSDRESANEDISYFVVFVADGPSLAVFVIYPDMERAEYSARDKVQSGWQENREEVLLEAAIEVEEGSDIEGVVKLVIQTKFRGSCVASIRSATIRFKRDVLSLLLPNEAKERGLRNATPSNSNI